MFISIDVPSKLNKTDVNCLSKRLLTLFIFDYKVRSIIVEVVVGKVDFEKKSKLHNFESNL